MCLVKFKNYKSYKDEAAFSFEAQQSDFKPENFFIEKLTDGRKIKLLKAAVIYGPNASGKSNLFWARSRRFSFDAYTDVDELVNRLIGQNKRILWYRSSCNIPFNGTYVSTIKSNKDFLMIQNIGNSSAIIKFANISITDNPKADGILLTGNLKTEILPVKSEVKISLTNNGDYLRMLDENKILIIELNS